MKKSKNILSSCDEANHTCDKTQYNEASLWEKIKLNVHLLYCKACREYSKNNRKLSNLIHGKDLKIMPSKEKENLQHAFDKELKNHK